MRGFQTGPRLAGALPVGRTVWRNRMWMMLSFDAQFSSFFRGLCLAALALVASFGHASTRPVATQPALPERPTFYITPNVEGLLLCDAERDQGTSLNFAEAEEACARQGGDASGALSRLLDSLEPGGARGQVQVGYTLTFPLLSLYKQEGTDWVLDEGRIDPLFKLVEKIDRPVVLYLQSTHFDSQGPLPAALMKDPRNLMQFADGKPPALGYFGYPIHPYTLQVDESISVNRYRFSALRLLSRRIAALPEPVRAKVIGITLAGEVHHLYPDFQAGMGAFDATPVTDYSPASVAGFRRALAAQYGRIETLNAAMGVNETSFDTVPAPSKDIRRDKLDRFTEHYDAWAGGWLPIAGWVFDPQQRIDALELYIDGRYLGPVQRGLNRLDVYRAVEEVDTPNVGFRYDLDFSTLKVGRHRAQVIAVSGGEKYLLAEVPFVVVGRDQARVPDHLPAGVSGLKADGTTSRLMVLVNKVLRRLGFDRPLPGPASLPGVHSWLDMPRSLQDLYYNPLARAWDVYRDQQTRRFLKAFFDIALESGLPADKLFSHQIVPDVNSSWNRQLFATNSTLQAGMPWRPGFNLYGGAANSDWMRAFLKQRNWTDYGVPEFHPQVWKRPGEALGALHAQYEDGARFVSPMYISLVPQRFRHEGQYGFNLFELSDDNPKEGSADFLAAIRSFAQH